MNDTLPAILGCDVDPDRYVFGGARLDRHRADLRWQGLAEGIPRLTSMLDTLPFFVPVTWNIRCDEQIAACHGEPAWLFARFADIWETARRRGDELAWHNHTYRWTDRRGCWFQEIADRSWIDENFAQWGEAFARANGKPAFTSHGGWFFQNDLTLAALAKAGVQVDYSALPGRAQQGFANDEGSDFVNHYDWSTSPRRPYRPAAEDYRRPAAGGETALNLTMAATYTFRGSVASAFQLASYLARRKGGGAQAAQAQSPMSIVTISNHPLIFSGLIDYALRERPPVMFVYFHTDELLVAKPTWKTRLFAAENIVTNLRRLTDRFARRGVSLQFVTCEQAMKNCPATETS